MVFDLNSAFRNQQSALDTGGLGFFVFREEDTTDTRHEER